MKYIILIFITLTSTYLCGQSANSSSLRLSASNEHHLYIRFENTFTVGIDSDIAKHFNIAVEGFEALQKEYNIELFRGIPMMDEQFSELEAREMRISKTSDKVANLRSIFQIKISNPTNENLYNLGSKLQKLKGVVYCSLISANPIKLPADIPPTTSNYQAQQSYIGENPGVNMQYAWDNMQTASGITIRNIEYGVNVNHEEFAGGGASIAAGMNISSAATIDYTEHGTCVFGVVYANNGTYGVSGLAHGATAMILYPEWQQSGYNRINAVTQAVVASQLGDVIIYEMQEYGQSDNFVCAEFNQVVWDLTVAASATGAIVVAAAGNGNQNLDLPFYASYMNRGDSGALIVGAGTSNSNHSKLYFSTYGSRVNVQGWGQNVYTTGYIPELNGFKFSDDFNQSYTPSFNGTSAATPMVASCVAVLQSYHHSLAGTYLTAIQMRAILQQTGIAQSSAFQGNIGPFPNMQAAMQLIYSNYLLEVKKSTIAVFSVYPNPAATTLNIVASEDFSEGSSVVIFNTFGQKVLSTFLSEQSKIDISNLNQGVYFVQINSEKGFSATQKIIKK